MLDDVIVHYLTDGFWEQRGLSPRKFNVSPGGTLTANITALTPEGQQLAKWALESWTVVSGINFRLVSTTDADITFDDNRAGAYAQSVVTGGIINSSHINITAAAVDLFGAGMDSYTFRVYIHEIGHALGLGHPGPYNAGDAVYPDFDDPSDFLLYSVSFYDSWQMSVMSYASQEQNFAVSASYAYPVTPMIADIAAIHNIYGAPNGVNDGDTWYGVGADTGTYLDEVFLHWTGQGEPFSFAITMTLYDTDGTDWLNFYTDRENQYVDLNPGTASSVYGLDGNLVIAHDTIIEHFIGGYGDDIVFGNDAANGLYTGPGDDVVFGGAGNDYLFGYSGDDLLRGDSGDDILDGGEGNDILLGGLGRDTFVFEPENFWPFTDTIIDFAHGQDKLDLTAFPTIDSVQDLDFYWTDETQTSTYIDLTEHEGGRITLVGYTDSLYQEDFLFA